MKIILLKDIDKLGAVGEVKEVADGYGRNYLIPKGLATLATREAMERAEALKKRQARELAQMAERAQDLAQRLEGFTVTIRARVGGQDRLYGSVTAADIAQELSAVTGVEIDRRQVELEESIHSLGSYPVPLRLGPGITATVTVVVEGEGEQSSTQGEAGSAEGKG